ncbi:MAG: hypothetical protein HY886_10040 [Deltaproteobacteria bacterium]|nr:hypothetical protein [Deltaproteobacteria bacterium]
MIPVNLRTPTLVLLLSCAVLGGAPRVAEAASAVTLPWSTTFNCNEWKQADGLYKVDCDDLKGWGAWTCYDRDGTLHEEQITSAANHAAGGGGKGQRHWKGYNGTKSTAASNNSGGMAVEFSSAQPDLWVRWYMRYQTGFNWHNIIEDKIIYFDVLSKQTSVIVAWEGDKSKILAQSAGSRTFRSSTANGWTGTMGGAGSDGLWHLYEVHLKMNTSGADGMAEMWIDDKQVISNTGVDWRPNGTKAYLAGWSYILFGSNSRSPDNNFACAYADFDDIAISNTGYIGPLNKSTDILNEK